MILKTSILSAISALSLTAFGATTFSSFTNEKTSINNLELSDSNKQFESQKQDQKIYWYDGRDDYEFKNTFTNGTNIEKYFYWEVNLGKTDVLNGYSKWIGLDDNNKSETWTAWGNDRYTGTAWKSVSESNILNVDLNKWGSTNDKDIYENSKIKMLYVEDWSGAAWFKSEQWVGVSYFKRSSNYYLSVFGYQKAATAWSFSGGLAFMNLGNGIKFVG